MQLKTGSAERSVMRCLETRGEFRLELEDQPTKKSTLVASRFACVSTAPALLINISKDDRSFTIRASLWSMIGSESCSS